MKTPTRTFWTSAALAAFAFTGHLLAAEAPPHQPAAETSETSETAPAVVESEQPGTPTSENPPDLAPPDLAPPKPLADPTLKGLAWLADSQNADGGWGQGGGWRVDTSAAPAEASPTGRVEGDNVPDPSDIGNTAIALQAFLRAGTALDAGEHSAVAAKAVAFLFGQLEADDDKNSLYVTNVRDTQLQSKIGAFVDTFLAAQTLADLKGRLPNADDEARRDKLLDGIVAKIQAHQKDDGAFAGNRGWASTLSQGICSRSLNSAWAAGATVDLAALEKDHRQNATGLDRASGAVAAASTAEVADAGIEIYRYAAKLGGMTDFQRNNSVRRAALEGVATAPTAPPEAQAEAAAEIAKIDEADADQQILLKQVVGRVAEDKFVAGFGNHGGEEFISYMNIGEALRLQGGEEWTRWDESMTKTLHEAQNADGSWTGRHCITGRTFCTASALMVLMTDRAPGPVLAVASKTPAVVEP